MRELIEYTNKTIKILESKGMNCHWAELHMNSEGITSGPWNAVGITSEWDGQSQGPNKKFQPNEFNEHYDQAAISVNQNGQLIGHILFTKDQSTITEFIIGPAELANLT